MGSIGPLEILIIALVALLLFGAGRIADIGKGLGQGIKNFKQGLREADEVDKKGADKVDKPAAASEKKDDAKESKAEAKAKEA
jgi:sec-independent protein translocase protein TatA